jgi:gliding motility-associated-like protein
MKKLIQILFLFFYINGYSQQIFELCEGSKTHTYFASFQGPGTNTWYVNGTPYVSDELTYTFTQPGNYNIVLRRDNGPCYDEVNYQVTVTNCPGIIYWVPNSFTPDGNEHNQLFGPIMTEGHDINGFSFKIFNRWGEIIWESNDPNGKWDGSYNGKLCQDGTYIWKLQFNVFGDDGKIENSGHVILIR